jgi:hypothetical protein
MTLIAGLRGAGKSYLVADSRATSTGNNSSKDDVLKRINLGNHAVCVVTGNALMAVYVCNTVLAGLPDDPSYAEVKRVFDNGLERITKEFKNKTGLHTSSVIMLAGYRHDEMESLDAGKLGEVMAAGAKKQGRQTADNQKVDVEILRSMHYATTMSELLGQQATPGSRITVNGPKSELTAYAIHTTPNGVEIDVTEADTFEALICDANTAVNKLVLPADRILDIYFRDTSGQNADQVMQIDGIHVIDFVNSIIEKHEYKYVGGNVISLLITPETSVFTTGGVGRIDPKSGKPEIIDAVKIIKGTLHYKDADGQYKPYRSLKDIKEASGLSPALQL